jgi:extradiol dioxygenase
MEITGLGYIGFNTRAVDEWLTLAPEVFGFQLAPRGADGSLYLRMDDRAWRIALHPGADDEVSYLGWELRGRCEFEAALGELKAADVSVTVASGDLCASRRVSGMAYFFDPAGFRHEIFYAQEFEPGSFLPGRPISGFVAGRLGLGHAILAVPEVTDELRNFAIKILGFRIFAGYRTVGPRGEILGLEFYRCNPRSHCMAYIPAADARGLTHVGLEVHSLDDVGRAWDLVQERNIPIKMSLGRHTMDNLVSFYIRSPSGFELEYGTGGDLLDDATFIMQKPNKAEVWGHKFMLKGWGSTVKPVKPSRQDTAAE